METLRSREAHRSNMHSLCRIIRELEVSGHFSQLLKVSKKLSERWRNISTWKKIGKNDKNGEAWLWKKNENLYSSPRENKEVVVLCVLNTAPESEKTIWQSTGNSARIWASSGVARMQMASILWIECCYTEAKFKRMLLLGVIEKSNARAERERVTQGRKKQDKRERDMKMMKKWRRGRKWRWR